MEPAITIAIILISILLIQYGSEARNYKKAKPNPLKKKNKYPLVNKQKETLKTFKYLKENLNLTLAPGSFTEPPVLHGKKGPLKINITQKGNKYFAISLYYELISPRSILITKLNNFRVKTSNNGIPRYKTGDYRFDTSIALFSAHETNEAAIFNASIRDRLIYLSKSVHHLNITNLELQMFIENSPKISDFQIASTIKTSINILNDFINPIDQKEAILHNAFKDPSPGCRFKNLSVLLKHFSVNRSIWSELKKALKDNDLQVQILAAKHLGTIGMDHLTKIISGNTITPIEKEELIRILIENHHTKAAPTLMEVFNNNSNIPLKKQILHAFLIFRDKRTEPLLIKTLENNSNDLSMEAIKALKTCGTNKSIEALHLLLKNTYNFFTRGEINATIETIQANLGDVQNGWLSVNEINEKDGALSIDNDADRGALSVSDNKEKFK